MGCILTYGTFDLFHFGHVRLLERAAALGGALYVGVSTDAFNAEKGKTSVHDFDRRCADVMNTGLVGKVFAETSFEQKVPDLVRYRPRMFVMGDDWAGRFDWISAYCEVAYLPRTPGISTTLLKRARSAKL